MQQVYSQPLANLIEPLKACVCDKLAHKHILVLGLCLRLSHKLFRECMETQVVCYAGVATSMEQLTLSNNL